LSASIIDFKGIFKHFKSYSKGVKVVHVATCDESGKPNSAPKMLVEVSDPDTVYYIDYSHTKSYTNICHNKKISLSFMSDADFIGYRFTGVCEIVDSGGELAKAKKIWDQRLISYEASRIIARVRGNYSAREAESALPADFVLVKMTAKEGAVVKPDRILRAVK
jgi:general stress protein 26